MDHKFLEIFHPQFSGYLQSYSSFPIRNGIEHLKQLKQNVVELMIICIF